MKNKSSLGSGATLELAVGSSIIGAVPDTPPAVSSTRFSRSEASGLRGHDHN